MTTMMVVVSMADVMKETMVVVWTWQRSSKPKYWIVILIVFIAILRHLDDRGGHNAPEFNVAVVTYNCKYFTIW